LRITTAKDVLTDGFLRPEYDKKWDSNGTGKDPPESTPMTIIADAVNVFALAVAAKHAPTFAVAARAAELAPCRYLIDIGVSHAGHAELITFAESA